MVRQLALVVALFMLSSCAAVFAEDTRSVVVTSNPPGAEIYVNGVAYGVTPKRIPVDNHSQLAVSIRKDGFHGAGCFVNTKIRPIWLIGDLLLIWAFAIPLVVDLVTDSWSILESEYCTVNLAPHRQGS
jgi:hypothetical protein